jgi:hypothetical protein
LLRGLVLWFLLRLFGILFGRLVLWFLLRRLGFLFGGLVLFVLLFRFGLPSSFMSAASITAISRLTQVACVRVIVY